MAASEWHIDVSGSPCMLQDHLHSSYAGYAEPDEIVALLRDLERQARADVGRLAERRRSPGTAGATVADLERRRVHHWLMLRRQLERLRRRSLASTNDKWRPRPRHTREAPYLMTERRAALANRIEEILPRIADDGLHEELKRLRRELQEDSRLLQHLIR